LRCELFQLPEVGLWTLTGLPVALRNDVPPSAVGPGLIVEIPRRGTDCRIQDLVEAGSITSGTLDDLTRRVETKDWIILKIDCAVPMSRVLELLTHLRDHGIARVDLAVVSYGYAPLPESPTQFVLGGEVTDPVYRPRTVPGRRNVIVVKKYVPADQEPDPRQRCTEVDIWEQSDAWREWMPEPSGSLPANVSISVTQEQNYGEFIGALQGAISGGAQRVHLTLDETPE
jgi:biopolymer transport protein ExbD